VRTGAVRFGVKRKLSETGRNHAPTVLGQDLSVSSFVRPHGFLGFMRLHRVAAHSLLPLLSTLPGKACPPSASWSLDLSYCNTSPRPALYVFLVAASPGAPAYGLQVYDLPPLSYVIFQVYFNGKVGFKCWRNL
jgi:hypothetical protein